MSIVGEAGSITTTRELASSTASRRESRVVVTQATAELRSAWTLRLRSPEAKRASRLVSVDTDGLQNTVHGSGQAREGARPRTNLAGGYSVLCLSRILRFGDSDVLEKLGQALGVVYRLSETCRLVSTGKPSDLVLQCRFLNGGDEIQRCLRRRLAPATPRHAADHPVIPKCGGFARRALRMSPQTTVTQTADQPPQIQQREQECGGREHSGEPSHREIDHVIVGAPCRPQHRAMLPSNPPASLVKEMPAAGSR